MKQVHIIGGGFSGLTLALGLARRGCLVDLYESTGRLGGLLGTEKTEWGLAEQAANAIIKTELSEALFQELELTPLPPKASAKKRFIFRDFPRQWPLKVVETLGLLIRFLPRILLSRKSLQPRSQETLQDWGLRNFGPAGTRFLLGPAMQGIYANDIKGLSASMILGSLFKKKTNKKYRGLITGVGGMQDLVDHLEKRLTERGVRIHLNSQVNVSDLRGSVVVATSAKAACSLLKESHPQISEALSKISMSSLVSMTLFFSKPQTKYQGFGCLIPRGLGLKTLGVLMNSYIFPHRDQTYNETWILGGVDEEDLSEWEDKKLLQLIAEERFAIFKDKQPLLDYRIQRWQKALPYYDLMLEQVSEELKNLPAEKNLFLHGNYLSGIGLSKILERSEQLAEEILRHDN